MLIPCPYCGPRIHEEFTYLGDATLRRPDPAAAGAEEAYFEYGYLRDNPAGPHQELWFHAAGCHAWIVVERDTRTHLVQRARPARELAASGAGS
ncbi:MAG: sarcosine oxidase subunit delta [Steroidobacteraceae bacterium]